MQSQVLLYTIYLAVTLAVIFLAGRVLYNNGIHFLVSCFHGDAALASSSNRILLSGYYLLNMGYAVYAVKVWTPVVTIEQAILQAAYRAGMLVLAIGIIHLFNMALLLLAERIHLKKTYSTKNQSHEP